MIVTCDTTRSYNYSHVFRLLIHVTGIPSICPILILLFDKTYMMYLMRFNIPILRSPEKLSNTPASNVIWVLLLGFELQHRLLISKAEMPSILVGFFLLQLHYVHIRFKFSFPLHACVSYICTNTYCKSWFYFAYTVYTELHCYTVTCVERSTFYLQGSYFCAGFLY